MQSVLENKDFFNGDVYITPPGDGLNSDEDSNDKDCPEQNPDYLSSKQKQAAADFVFISGIGFQIVHWKMIILVPNIMRILLLL